MSLARFYPRASALAAAVAIALFACACGGQPGPGFDAPLGLADASSDSGGDTAGTTFLPDDGGGTSLMLGDTGGSSGGMGTGTCKDGTYSGTFACTFMFNPDAGGDASTVSADAGGLMITGNISFKLVQMTGNGESFIDTASGTFSGTAATFFAISANVGGTLNCNSGVFTGSLTGGMYSGFLFINGTFSGPLDSQYNGATFSFVGGSWFLTVPGEGSCPGTWTANYTGP